VLEKVGPLASPSWVASLVAEGWSGQTSGRFPSVVAPRLRWCSGDKHPPACGGVRQWGAARAARRKGHGVVVDKVSSRDHLVDTGLRPDRSRCRQTAVLGTLSTSSIAPAAPGPLFSACSASVSAEGPVAGGRPSTASGEKYASTVHFVRPRPQASRRISGGTPCGRTVVDKPLAQGRVVANSPGSGPFYAGPATLIRARSSCGVTGFSPLRSAISRACSTMSTLRPLGNRWGLSPSPTRMWMPRSMAASNSCS
jgi:hypothetical protein